jgi:hypothetical protein
MDTIVSVDAGSSVDCRFKKDKKKAEGQQRMMFTKRARVGVQ